MSKNPHILDSRMCSALREEEEEEEGQKHEPLLFKSVRLIKYLYKVFALLTTPDLF